MTYRSTVGRGAPVTITGNRLKISVFLLVAVMSFAAGNAQAATVNVSPGQSIQNAINSAAVGDTVLIAAGDYTGGITVNKAITVQGQPGAKINASTQGSGTGVTISADGCTVAGLSINAFQNAIAPSGLSARSNVTIKNNHTYYSQFHVWINGTNWLIEGNEFERVRWWDGQGDADYTRMFGTGHVFRGNYLHGTNFSNTDLAPASGSDYAHTDGIQYYGNNGEVLKNCTIENNFFTDFHQGLFLCDEFSGSLQNLTIRNNVFWGQTYTPAPGSSNFGGNPSWGICIAKNVGGTGMIVQNNLMYNIANFYGIRAASSGNWTKNIVVGKGGAGTVYDPSTSNPSTVTVGNILYGHAWVGQSGFAGSDISMNPLLSSVSNPLGADGIPMTADDGWKPTASGALTYGPQLTASGNTVVATPDTFTGITEDAASVTLNVLSNDTLTARAVLSVASVTAPNQGGTAVITGGGASLTYTPKTNWSGNESFTYTATDGAGATANATVTVTVVAVNDPPSAANDAYTVAANSSNNAFTVLTNDSITPDTGETLSISSVTTPNYGGTATISSNTILYSPAASFSGTETFSYTISDGKGGTSSASVSVTVAAAPNNVPVALGDSYSGIQEDSSSNILNVRANDSDADGDTLTITSRTSPTQGGTAAISSGTIIYAPKANYSGIETFSYTISDGKGGTATASVTVTVAAVNDVPVAKNDSYSVNLNSSANAFAVLSNDTDADADTLSITDLGASANGGTVSVSGSGLSYTPATNFSGSDSFTYTVSDGKGGTATASVTVTITDTNTAPIANADAYTISKNSSANSLAPCTNDSDPNPGDTFTLAGVGVPNRGGSVSMPTATSVAYSPAANYVGTETFTYTIRDSRGATSSAQVTITVKDTAPIANPDRYKVRGNKRLRGEEKKNRLSVLKNDVSNSDTPLALAGTLQEARAAHGLVELEGNDILYTPMADYIGSEAFIYTIRDGLGQTATGEVTVEVTEDIGLNLCENYPAILVELAELYSDFSFKGDDIDTDGIPDDFMLEAMQIIACFETDSQLGIAIETAYQINLMMLDSEANAPALANYREAIAALAAMNTGMQGVLNQTLDSVGLTLTQTYESVSCDESGVCMPQPVAGTSLAEGFQVFDEGRGLLEEPFSGPSDIDGDGLTNSVEYANVVSAGGSRTEFAAAVTDPSLDGLAPARDSGGGGGGGCFIATAAYGTPLASQIDVFRTIRDHQMLNNGLGAAFVDTYYRLSPPLARLVADYPAVASLVRALLWPIVIIGKAFVAAPTLLSTALLALAAVATMGARQRRQTV